MSTVEVVEHTNAERLLALTVIVQAFHDAFDDRSHKSERTDARQWILTLNSELEFWCRAANLSAEAVVRAAKRRLNREIQ